jgi:hypothetical protein
MRDTVTEKRKKDLSSTSYSVGYGKPPEATRFPPKKSGNPKGRPKGRNVVEPAIHKVLDETIIVTGRGTKRRMPAHEVMLRRLRTAAMNGDVKAARLLLDQKERHPKPVAPETANSLNFERLDDEEFKTLVRLFRKAYGVASGQAPEDKDEKK